MKLDHVVVLRFFLIQIFEIVSWPILENAVH